MVRDKAEMIVEFSALAHQYTLHRSLGASTPAHNTPMGDCVRLYRVDL